MADAITARIAATKRRLLDGGVLQPVEWGVPGEPDVRGRKTFTYSLLDAVVEQRPALQREGGFTTDRADNTVLIILDPVAITDGHTFPMGRPAPHLLGQSQSTGSYRTKKPGRDTPPKSC